MPIRFIVYDLSAVTRPAAEFDFAEHAGREESKSTTHQRGINAMSIFVDYLSSVAPGDSSQAD
jgi:hypothetical protein